jgi:hypothetical protein
VIVNDELTGQTLATYVAPTAWSPFALPGRLVTIGGTAEANVLGDGSITIGASMRDDAYALGTSARWPSPSRPTSRRRRRRSPPTSTT